MKTAVVAVGTMTLARDRAEESLLRKSMLPLSRLGFPVIATDGGSPPEFLRFLKNLGITTGRSRRKGLVAQVQESLKKAAGLNPQKILYTEPDKLAFFQGPILELLRAAEKGSRKSVIIAARNKKGFATFPPAQRKAETIANDLAGELFGSKGDYCYGPFIFPRELVKEVQGLTGEIGWGWRFHLFKRARGLGYDLRHVELPVKCPGDQREETAADRIYRFRQLRQNLQAMVG